MELFTTQEAAEFLHVPLPTLRHWISKSQAPPSAKIGRRRMFLKSGCADFVQAKFADAAKTSAVG
jgi:excisionase family DNA binding protein